MRRPHLIRTWKIGLAVVREGWTLTGDKCEECGDPMIQKAGEVICLSEFAKRMALV